MAWDLTGNAGTNPANNFLGTADNQPLVVKTAGRQALRVDAQHRVSIGTSTPVIRTQLEGTARR